MTNERTISSQTGKFESTKKIFLDTPLELMPGLALTNDDVNEKIDSNGEMAQAILSNTFEFVANEGHPTFVILPNFPVPNWKPFPIAIVVNPETQQTDIYILKSNAKILETYKTKLSENK